MPPNRHYWTCEKETCVVCADFQREITHASDPYRELTKAQLTAYEQPSQERLHDYQDQ